tara:strand:+ start:28460 stop:29227 length:768 start_codon:yes stop_codon:yes gene_type:complete
MFIDTHTHLYLKDFDDDRDAIIKESIYFKIEKLFLPNIDSNSIENVIKLTEKYKNICYPMVGLHPCSIKQNFESELEILKNYIGKIKPIAIGETGIDLYWEKTNLNEQIEAFKEQIKWAKDYNLPIVIHARDSYKEIFNVLDEMNDDTLFGVFHCFSSSLSDAKRIIDYGGFKLGIGGVVTFKNAGLDKTLAEIPLEEIVLETDSPYLTPAPYRGKRNKSSYISLIAKKISEIYNLKISEIEEITTKNACEIFKF